VVIAYPMFNALAKTRSATCPCEPQPVMEMVMLELHLISDWKFKLIFLKKKIKDLMREMGSMEIPYLAAYDLKLVLRQQVYSAAQDLHLTLVHLVHWHKVFHVSIELLSGNSFL
jgi:hypothetical protein